MTWSRAISPPQRNPRPMNLADADKLLTELDSSPESVQLHHGELKRLVASCMDAVYDLSVSGEDNERKMRLVAIEYQARLLLERFKKLAVN